VPTKIIITAIKQWPSLKRKART